MSSYSRLYRTCGPGSKVQSIANRKGAMGQISEERIKFLQSLLIAGKVECAQRCASMQGSNACLRDVSLGPLALYKLKALMIRYCL